MDPQAALARIPANRPLRVFGLVWVTYAFFAAGWIGNPMGRSILDLTIRAVDDGTITIDPYAPNSVDVAFRNGHFYSGMPPGSSALAVPLYVVTKPALQRVPEAWNERAAELTTGTTDVAPTPRRAELLILSALFVLFLVAPAAALSVVLLVTIWRRVWGGHVEPPWLRIATVLFAFGTLHFYYGANVEHRAISTAMLLGAFTIVLGDDHGPARLGLAGVLLGGAVTVTTETLLIAVLIGAWALWRLGPRALAIAAGAAGPLLLLAWYNTAAFGSPWSTGYSFRALPGSAPPLITEGAGIRLDPAALLDHLFGSGHGLFFYSPVLLLALLPLVRGPRPRGVVFGWAVAACLLAFHVVSGYRGLPGEYGFRQMLPALPFAAIGLPGGLAIVRRLWAINLIGAASVLMVGKGVMWGLHARGFDALEPLTRWGLTTYTLRQFNDHIAHIGPAASTALAIAGIGMLAGGWLRLRPPQPLRPSDTRLPPG